MKTSDLLLVSTAIACGSGHAPRMTTPSHPDAATTNPEKYRVVLENNRVRVLDYVDHPGDKTAMHVHPDFILHALGPFERRLWFPDGTSRLVSFRGGETEFMRAQAHAGENVGTTDTHVLIIELKER